MENKSYYIKGIAKTLGTAALSVIVALMIAREIGGESLESFGVMAALAVACVPFGWSSMSSITAGLLVWGLVGILVYFFPIFFLCRVVEFVFAPILVVTLYMQVCGHFSMLL